MYQGQYLIFILLVFVWHAHVCWFKLMSVFSLLSARARSTGKYTFTAIFWFDYMFFLFLFFLLHDLLHVLSNVPFPPPSRVQPFASCILCALVKQVPCCFHPLVRNAINHSLLRAGTSRMVNKWSKKSKSQTPLSDGAVESIFASSLQLKVWPTTLEEWGDISLKICEEENRLINIGGRRRAKRKNTSNSRRGKPWSGVKGFRASKIALNGQPLFWPPPVKGMPLGTRSQNATWVLGLFFFFFWCLCARKCSRVRCLNTWPPDLLETVCSYRRIHMDYSSAHVIFIIQYCNRLFSIAVDYTTDLVPKLTRSRCIQHHLCSCAKKEKNHVSVVLIKAPLIKCLISNLQRAHGLNCSGVIFPAKFTCDFA